MKKTTVPFELHRRRISKVVNKTIPGLQKGLILNKELLEACRKA